MPRRKLDPLPSAAFNILLALAGEDLHGYAIMRQVEQQTCGRMRLGPGTLYGSLRTLLEASLIEELEDGKDSSGPKDSAERRRFYRLTPAGLKLVRAEVESLAQTLRIARAKRILRGADA
jgi:DNA-binding PadR family transcriptional regulator